MAAALTVGELPEAEYGRWEKFVAAAPGGSVYSLPTYLDALCTAAGGRFRLLAARQGEEIAGGVALYERDARLGRYVAPRLLLYYNGIMVRRYDTQYPSESTGRILKVLGALEDALRGAGLASVNLRSRGLLDARPFLAGGWTAAPSYSYVVDLTDLTAAWGRVEQNLRRLIERAESQGLVFSEDQDFDAFFSLHATTLERHGTGVYLPRAAFARYVQTLGERNLGRLYLVRAPDGRAVAAQWCLLGPHPVSHTASAGADPEFNKSGASAFLRWRAFHALAALGFRGNDLTDASLNPVTHFKSQFGGSLELTLVLQSRVAAPFRMAGALSEAGWAARERMGTWARRLMGKGNA